MPYLTAFICAGLFRLCACCMRPRREASVQAGETLTASVTDSTDAEAEATLAELRSTAQRSDQEVMNVSRCPHTAASRPDSCR